MQIGVIKRHQHVRIPMAATYVNVSLVMKGNIAATISTNVNL